MTGDLEYAMTHVSIGGGLRACPRPEAARTTAARVRQWRDTPEPCTRCQQAPARSLWQGQALCPACREQLRWALDETPPQTRAAADQIAGQGFDGYAVVFGELSLDLGGFREKIAPEAVSRTLSEGLDVRALWSHNPDLPLGRVSAGTLQIQADRRGLRTLIAPPSWAAMQVESVDRGDVTGMSFGFRALDDEWFLDGPIPIREVRDMRISEVSIVSFPAYPTTSVSVTEELKPIRGAKLDWLAKRLKTQMARS